MKNSFAYYFIFLLLTGFPTSCKDSSPEFSTGTGDRRITGTWQLLERRFIKDSVYTVRIDTITTTRDTIFYATKRYPRTELQTITFGTDGKLSANGTEMTYYYPIRYFHVDSTFYGLGLNLYISTNRANVPFRQGLEFRKDTLVLLPQCFQDSCNQGYFLKFLRAQ